MAHWEKIAVKQLGTAETTALLDWCSQKTGCAPRRLSTQASSSSSSLPLLQSHSQRVRVKTTEPHMRQWLRTSSDLTAPSAHPVDTLFFHQRQF